MLTWPARSSLLGRWHSNGIELLHHCWLPLGTLQIFSRAHVCLCVCVCVSLASYETAPHYIASHPIPSTWRASSDLSSCLLFGGLGGRLERPLTIADGVFPRGPKWPPLPLIRLACQLSHDTWQRLMLAPAKLIQLNINSRKPASLWTSL